MDRTVGTAPFLSFFFFFLTLLHEIVVVFFFGWNLIGLKRISVIFSFIRNKSVDFDFDFAR